MFINEYCATASSKKGILVSTEKYHQCLSLYPELTFIHIFGEPVENTTGGGDVKERHRRVHDGLQDQLVYLISESGKLFAKESPSKIPWSR